MHKTLSASLVAVAGLAFAGAAGAADRGSVNFMQKAAMAGHAEVELSRLALDRSADRDVRRFAQRMIDDHTRAGDELARLARQENVRLYVDLDRQHRQALTRLGRMRGNGFDRAYMDLMNQDHQQAVQLFRTQARNGRDREVRDFAARVLPTLQDHHSMARDVRRGEHREARHY